MNFCPQFNTAVISRLNLKDEPLALFFQMRAALFTHYWNVIKGVKTSLAREHRSQDR